MMTQVSAWTLEQFDASDDTIASCSTERPEEAIHFDFYEHPGERIAYREHGLTYRVDGLRRGQIGVKEESGASFIGNRPVSIATGAVTRNVRQLNILLAEDNQVNQQLASRVLEKRGHKVVVVDPGKKAITALEKQHFDVVLMDGRCR